MAPAKGAGQGQQVGVGPASRDVQSSSCTNFFSCLIFAIPFAG